MTLKIVLLLSILSNGVLGQTPSPPNPQQFVITADKPTGTAQLYVTTNYVDRYAGLFRIDVTNEGRLIEQAFYNVTAKLGYDIDYDQNPPKCAKTKENYADMLAQWQTLPYSGKTMAISQPGLECDMWNLTDQSYTWSYLASVKHNIPIEILDQSILISVFRNYTVGPQVVPEKVFHLPIPEHTCK